jgi:DNA polymerase III subunit beta
MKFTAHRDTLLRALQLVTGVVERRQTLPVLSNLHVIAGSDGVAITGTDLEVELVARLNDGVDVANAGQATIPARKLTDIWRSLPDGSTVTVDVERDRAIVRSGRSRFSLATLPAADFPRVEAAVGDLELSLSSAELRRLLNQTAFSMAQQDVRYFLNGMLLEVAGKHIRTVATDGHRLAMCTMERDGSESSERRQVIVPRKGILELGRLLAEDGEEVLLSLARNHLRATSAGYTMTTKLVDGRFPDYERVIPKESSNVLTADRESLKQAFARASILSNEKYRGVRIVLEPDQMTVRANNPEQEEAEEIVAVSYGGQRLEIGFNVSYLQDVLSALTTESVRISVSDANSSALIEGPGADDSVYVVMPMRL